MTTLNRTDHGRPAAPVRILHLGIGNFTRAHQAWYTEHAHDAADWGIAAFTGRSPAIAETLAPSEGLYQLCVADPDGDEVEVIGSLSAVHAADDLAAWRGYFADPHLAIVTSTITEAGYLRDKDGNLDLTHQQLAADLAALQADPQAQVATAPAKFVAGLLARRQAGGGKLTFCPCDNIPENGPMIKRLVSQAAQRVDPALVEWIEANVGVVTTMVDRITPRTTDEDRERVAAQTGVDDPALVVTEPFSEWVLSGDFVAGRPAWEDAGARFVDDVVPHEARKLTMLNGSHSLMAYAGPILGRETVCDAINDEVLLGWVNEFWDDAAKYYLTLPQAELDEYREALLTRYRNPRIRHLLAQIAADGSQKVAIRHVPTIKAALARGEVATGATRAVAAWILHLLGMGAPVTDSQADELALLVTGDETSSAVAVLDRLGINEPRVLETVLSQMDELRGRAA
ncbi:MULTISPECIES: mannitol dehydrogenase family protein [unclassified Luteococcus]|uniref:mannitol dehydrogenase family protein n=1 Tax=unclassified Luteococcus TaxID=2639923 RepID=UPI00313B6B51